MHVPRSHVRRLLAIAALISTLALAPANVAAGSVARATGGGWFLWNGAIPMQFGFSALVRPDGSAVGSFHHAYTDDVGSYLFIGTVTCVTFDGLNNRAWIGGVLTTVVTDDATLPFGPGDDAWFRVLDSPTGDRSTSMGFVGVIPSSAEYCATQPWPADNARTHPVTSGQITVEPG